MKPHCFGLYHVTLSAQLRPDVPTSRKEFAWVVFSIAASMEEKGNVESNCGKHSAAEPIVSKTELPRPNPRTQLSTYLRAHSSNPPCSTCRAP